MIWMLGQYVSLPEEEDKSLIFAFPFWLLKFLEKLIYCDCLRHEP